MKRTLAICAVLAMSACASVPAPSEKLNFADLPADAGDNLPGVLVSGPDLSFPVYRDANDARVAESVAVDLFKAYGIIAVAVGVDTSDVKWSEVALSRHADYQPPRHDGLTRWTVPLESTGALGLDGKKALYSVIPHEQVHVIQKRFGSLPRWYGEGMAEWAGLKATVLLQPDLADARRVALSKERLAVTKPLKLKAWGGVSPKPEAIMRQITPEQRKRMLSEPGYMPPGPFEFGPDDLLSDESNTLARYAASLEIFEAMEAKAGPDLMRRWIGAVAELPNPKKSDDIVGLANTIAGVDISKTLE